MTLFYLPLFILALVMHSTGFDILLFAVYIIHCSMFNFEWIREAFTEAASRDVKRHRRYR